MRKFWNEGRLLETTLAGQSCDKGVRLIFSRITVDLQIFGVSTVQSEADVPASPTR